MSNPKIDLAQSALRDVLKGLDPDWCKPSGDIGGDDFESPWTIYKLPRSVWCFKAGIPITAAQATAIGAYMAVLEEHGDPAHVSPQFERYDEDPADHAENIARQLGGGLRALGGRMANTIAGQMTSTMADLRDCALAYANSHNEPAEAVVNRAGAYFAFLKGK